MNSPQNIFLSSLFKAFDLEGLSYCVSRNADEIFSNSDSDVDLVVEPGDEKAAARVCIGCARENGYDLALTTRFANLCLLFWSATGGFIRIDIDNGIRWRIFPVIPAVGLLRERRRDGAIFVPSAVGEALVLTANVAWRGELSARYRSRLNVLWNELRTDSAKQPAGDAIEWIALARAADIRGLKRRLIANTLKNPGCWPATVGALITDATRFLKRTACAPGYYLSFRGSKALDWERLASHLKLAFPAQKSHRFQQRANPIRILSSLFRGGLVLEERLDSNDPPLPPADRPYRYLGAAANHLSVFRPGNGRLYLLHEDSGMMLEQDESAADPESQVADFIGKAMARNNRPLTHRTKGGFIVLVGLDGAGKTTFARNLCGKLAADPSVRRARYDHWIPRLTHRAFPWPSFAETPRKTPSEGIVHSLLSMLRLLKNMAHVRWIYHTGIRRWVRGGDFVLIDRFIYNYWLDPVSLRYSGPPWLLALAARVMPKPDLVFSLETDAETLLSRKRELNREQIERQSALLRNLPLNGVRKVVIDASLPPAEMVALALRELRPA